LWKRHLKKHKKLKFRLLLFLFSLLKKSKEYKDFKVLNEDIEEEKRS
jgi:hypothetical protein